MYLLILLVLGGASLVAAEKAEVSAMVREEVVAIEKETMVTQDLVVQDLTKEEIEDEEIDVID